ncbi:helix-turn-helix domain-containing protein [Streptomyces sp. x-80]|uniref:helix-turn-helix domain-containing protein n=1 Tax=Streptomyces sp. x-80 TaxID=2789282 RepID=UPI00397F42E3
MEGERRAGTAAVAIDSQVRDRLMRTMASVKSEVRAVLRARIVLAAADGLTNGAIARELDVSVNTVRKWRRRFAPLGLRVVRRATSPAATT